MKTFDLIIILISIFFFSCNNANKVNKTNNETDSSEISTNVNSENLNKTVLSAKLKFNGIYLSTDGAIYSFTTDKGEEFDVFDRTEIPQFLLDITANIQPNVECPEFENRWFYVEYEFVDKLFYDGYSGKDISKQVLQINTIKDFENNFSNNQNSDVEIYNLSDIKKDSEIYGLKVVSVDYKKGEYFSIQYSGKFSISGKLMYNDFEDSYDIYIDENQYPNVKINVEGKEYVLFMSLYVKNFDKMKKNMTSEQIQKLNSGNNIEVSLEAENLTTGEFLNDGGGRIGSGAVDFVKFN